MSFRYLTLTTSTKETLAFPPAQVVPDTIAFVKQSELVRMYVNAAVQACNNVGLVIAVIGEKTHDLGAILG